MTRRAKWTAALLVFVAAFTYFVSYVEYGITYDEGYLLDGVEKVMEGQVIYRDFHHTYAPGRFYLVAAAFDLFGKNIIVERFVFVFLQALKCGLAFLIAATITGSWIALLAPVLIMIAPGPWHKVFFSSMGFLSAYAVMIAIRKRPPWLLPAGITVGICAVFRQDTAGFAAIGGLLGMMIGSPRYEALKPEDSDRSLPEFGFRWSAAIGRLLRRMAYFACGIAIVVVPVAFYFHAEDALAPMVHKMTVDGMIDNMTNRVPYPGFSAVLGVDSEYVAHVLPVRFLFYLPLVAYALSFIGIVRQAVVRRWRPTMTSFVVLLAVSIMAFNQSIWRSDLGHLLQSMQYVFLLLTVLTAFACSALQKRWTGRRRLVLVLKSALILAAPVLLIWASAGITRTRVDRALFVRFLQEGISVQGVQYLGSIAMRSGNDTKLSLERAPVYVTPDRAKFFEALGKYLDTHTEPADYVLAVPQLQVLYFFYDRRNPTAYAHYRRALDPEEEERYIDDIRSHRTEYIFLTEASGGAGMGTKEGFSRYAKRVRQWILDNYEQVDRIGSVKVLRRKT